MSETAQDRDQLYIDLYEGRIPKRVPNMIMVHAAAAIELAGYELKTAQYGVTKLLDSVEKINAKYDSDNVMGSTPGAPFNSKLLGSRISVMGNDGFMQHPNFSAMDGVTELDDFNADPLKFLWEKAIPRMYTELDKPYPYNMINMLKYIKLNDTFNAAYGAGVKAIAQKYNKSANAAKTWGSGVRAPFDYYADYLRSFTGSMTDIRRVPEKVIEALEIITPLIIRCATPKECKNPTRRDRAYFALHMPTFMKIKDFEKFWWPYFKRAAWGVYDAGFGVNAFCEERWDQHADYLQELPPLCQLQFEYADAQSIKEKIGGKQIVWGFYPVDLLRNGSKEDVCDEAKKYIDILAPGGNYFFGTDKSILRGKSVNWENLPPLIETIQEYGRY